MAVLVQESLGLVDHPAGKVLDGKTQCVRFRPNVQFTFDIRMELFWKDNRLVQVQPL